MDGLAKIRAGLDQTPNDLELAFLDLVQDDRDPMVEIRFSLDSRKGGIAAQG